MTVRLIALMGAAQSGKTTVSRLLQTEGYRRERFAGPLKEMLHTLGLSWEQLDGSEKEVPCALLGGKTPRHAMQTIGTEWRDMIDTNLWSNVMEKRLQETFAVDSVNGRDSLIVIDDCRFPHEVELIQSMGGEVWVIRRASVEPDIIVRALSRLPKWLGRIASVIFGAKRLHPSELYWSSIEEDITIFNNGSQAELEAMVLSIIKE